MIVIAKKIKSNWMKGEKEENFRATRWLVYRRNMIVYINKKNYGTTKISKVY